MKEQRSSKAERNCTWAPVSMDSVPPNCQEEQQLFLKLKK